MTLDFSFKFKDYELRACPKRLARFSPDEKNETIDLIKWSGEENNRYCFSLGYFQRESEGYSFKFVGDRPFKHIKSEDVPTIWEALKFAQEVLNNFFNEEEKENDE